MRPKTIESDPRFVPHDRRSRTGGWTRIVLPLLVILGYLALAGLQNGPIQVWLVVLAPLAMIAIAFALDVTGDSRKD
jgi:hypothetical protein